jgi:TM2 domain-containing membrane protein YozV
MESLNETKEVSHHFSDIDTWKVPDRNYYVFVVLSFLFGLFGFDHFYLRSFGTGLQKLIVNIFGLGLWYIWDLLQITTEGKRIRKEGLNSPFDWILGIGRGMFMEGTVDPNAPKAPKSFLMFAFFAIVLGFLGFDKFYIGQNKQGLVKVFSVFSPLILFGLGWTMYDAFTTLFTPQTLLKDGISAPIPYSMLFSGSVNAKELFIPGEAKEEQNGSFLQQIGSALGVVKPLYDDFVVPLVRPTVRQLLFQELFNKD